MKNEVVIWDRIVRRKEDAFIKFAGKNKYMFRDISSSFKCVVSIFLNLFMLTHCHSGMYRQQTIHWNTTSCPTSACWPLAKQQGRRNLSHSRQHNHGCRFQWLLIHLYLFQGCKAKATFWSFVTTYTMTRSRILQAFFALARASTSGLILARKSALVLMGFHPIALERFARAREFVPR